MTWFARYLDAAVSDARAFLLVRGTLLLLAFDAWVLMIERGGRYGAGGFNVAHFAVLDALQPVPTAATYVGLVLLVGLLAFASALLALGRPAMIALATLYTYGWSMSMLDSYQHHYLFSIVLVTFAGIAPVPAADARSPSLRRGWGYPTLALSTAIVYVFTAVSKTEAEWRAGDALKRITSGGAAFAPLERFAANVGITSEHFWPLVGHSVVLLQLVIAGAYALAPRQDVAPSRALRAALWVGWGAAMSFHIGAEYLELRIGWFGWYMMLFACVFMLPRGLVEAIAGLVAAPSAWLGRLLDGESEGSAQALTPGIALAMSFAVAGLLGLLGKLVDVPGSLGAGSLAGVAIVLAAVVGVLRGQGAFMQRVLAAGALSGAAMWLSIASSDVRYDFYRYLGGDSRRRGDLETALIAYEKANRYAPPGKSRDDRVLELRRQLGR